MTDHLHIVELRASNVKRLKAVAIKPDGSVVQITGPNGAGKSSVLDSIFFALAGTKGHPSQPIRKGESQAVIEIDLGPIVVTRKFTEKGTTLEVSRKDDGSVFKKGQTALDSILGDLTFDPLAFTRLAPKQQLEQLRGLVKLDIDLDAVDQKIRETYEHRTDINRRAKTLQERVDTLAGGLQPDMDVELVDTAKLLDEMQSASEQQIARDRELQNRSVAGEKVERLRARSRELTKQAEDLLKEAGDLDRQAHALRSELDALPIMDMTPIDLSGIRDRLKIAERENEAKKLQLRQRSAHAEAVAQREAADRESDRLTGIIAECNQTKASAIAAAKMPIEGLSFGDGLVMYNGLPLDQASSAEQLRVAVAIGMAMNPRFRVLTIKDGSLLDTNSRAALKEMADANQFQIWIEIADAEAKDGIIIEDGQIVGAGELALVGE